MRCFFVFQFSLCNEDSEEIIQHYYMTNLHYCFMDQNDWLHSLLGEMDTAWQEVTRGLEKQCFGAHMLFTFLKVDQKCY